MGLPSLGSFDFFAGVALDSMRWLWLLCILLNNFQLSYVLYCFGSHGKMLNWCGCVFVSGFECRGVFRKTTTWRGFGSRDGLWSRGVFVFYVYSS